MQPSLRSTDHQNYQFTLMSKIFLSCTGLFLLSLLTACGGRPNVTVNIGSAETAKTESASNQETQEQSKTPQTPSSQQEADSSSAIATATEKPIQPLKPEPTESSPTSLALGSLQSKPNIDPQVNSESIQVDSQQSPPS